MRSHRLLLDELRRPAAESIWLPGTFFTLVWAFGFRCLFVPWMWFEQSWEVFGPPAPLDAAIVRLTTTVTAVHVGLLLLLIVEGVALRRRTIGGNTTPWVAWCLALGILAICQGATTAADLTHRSWLVERAEGAAHLSEARTHLAHERFEEAKDAYEAAVHRDSDQEWWRECLWLLVAHPDDRMRDPERAWRLGSWIPYGHDPLDQDLCAAILAARGEFDAAVSHLEFRPNAERRAASSLAAPVADAIERRLALYRAARPPPREPPYPGYGWHEAP